MRCRLQAAIALMVWLGQLPPLSAEDAPVRARAAAEAVGSFEDGRAAYLAKEYNRAFSILKPLAESGDAKAQVTLGIMYDYGYGVEKDAGKAISWYRKAAEQGVPAVQHDLGVKYYRGQDVAQDFKEAVKWWQMAAENGLADSQYNLGYMYSRGLGIAASDKDAFAWYSKAAAQNHMFAQYSLAVMHAFGKGMPVDYAQAAHWFRKASDQGMAQAQYNLGVLYENGQGVEKSTEEAKKWYKLAADQGLDTAARKYAALNSGIAAAKSASQNSATPASPRMSGDGSVHRSDWIAAQSADLFTLQIMSSTNEDALLERLRKENLAGDVAYFDAIVNGEQRYSAIYGVFPDQASAEAARDALPPALRKENPWVRKFGAIQSLIQNSGKP